MSGEGHEVRLQRDHVHGNQAGGLGGIQKEQDAPPAAQGAHFGDGLNRAAHVAGMGHDHESGRRFDKPCESLGVQVAAGVAGNQVIGDESRLAQHEQGPQNGVVFQNRRHDVVAGTANALNGHVKCAGGVGREYGAVGIRRGIVEQPVHPVTGLIHHASGFQGQVEPGASGIDRPMGHEIRHGRGHGGGFGETCGRVVKVDQWCGLRHAEGLSG